MSNTENLLRLKRKHGEGRGLDATAEDGKRIARQQSLRNAILASLIALILFCVLWVSLTTITNRVYPWMTVIFGWTLGLAIRKAGRGIDWRFPTLAAIVALTGSVVANVVVAASTTADSYGTSTMQILQAVTSMTWPVYFEEVWNIADGFFAVVSAGVAAFYANRRLTRAEFYAMRLWREQSDGHQ